MNTAKENGGAASSKLLSDEPERRGATTASMNLLDLIRENGRLRREQYWKQVQYEKAQEKAKAAAQSNEEAERLAEIANDDNAA